MPIKIAPKITYKKIIKKGVKIIKKIKIPDILIFVYHALILQ
jgi:hypothetical protein